MRSAAIKNSDGRTVLRLINKTTLFKVFEEYFNKISSYSDNPNSKSLDSSFTTLFREIFDSEPNYFFSSSEKDVAEDNILQEFYDFQKSIGNIEPVMRIASRDHPILVKSTYSVTLKFLDNCSKIDRNAIINVEKISNELLKIFLKDKEYLEYKLIDS